MINILTLLFVALISFSAPVNAKAEVATCEEAKKMAERAAEFLKEHGPETAFQAFNDKGGVFLDRSLYVFVFDENGKITVHAVKPHMEGRSGISLKDVYGSPYGKEIMAIKDTGWVFYKYPDPINKDRIRDKQSYVIKVGKYRLGSGCYSN